MIHCITIPFSYIVSVVVPAMVVIKMVMIVVMTMLVAVMTVVTMPAVCDSGIIFHNC
ncbi:MAG TPA: hypothetical protein VGP47_09360 [Parachlamydiaceae bacterium]|nr:hypothetical protein [Parachlamydiaceae bacterium]